MGTMSGFDVAGFVICWFWIKPEPISLINTVNNIGAQFNQVFDTPV